MFEGGAALSEVEVSNLRKEFKTQEGKVFALDGVSFTVPEGNLYTLLGPSGCGKSTTLRCIAGLEHADTGEITIGGQAVFSCAPRKNVPPEWRHIGMVFQSYAIWPHMTVFNNVAYPLQGHKLSKADIERKVGHVLAMVGLERLAKRPATDLSGGQQQRVALARALVAEPKVLLLDEPLSNLDAKLRGEMRTEIKKLQRQVGITAIYVTHDQEEALVVSDEILFMDKGQIVEKGKPEEIYLHPKNKLTANFFGKANFVEGELKGKQGEWLVAETAGGRITCSGTPPEGNRVSVFFRSENTHVSREKPEREYYLQGVISETQFLGQLIECSIEIGKDDQVRIFVHPNFKPRKGEQLYFTMEPLDCSILK